MVSALTNPNIGGPRLTLTEVQEAPLSDLWEWLAMTTATIKRQSRRLKR